ncbi:MULTISPECIES: response regulator transcription factor [Subtercola]|uniref:DNA-binding response regulator n=1 Tax=Subtercola vilae TaxID=2056433 RepID=A0A4T2BFN9_9MICO|nr:MULTISPECIES: response regulator transcription factor [Subtercola]MEA9986500.1 response regulator transcription factor [Subtercola sp. RTI3]TIH29650.1 DNA-binding response regulator [Subtercola vilae]
MSSTDSSSERRVAVIIEDDADIRNLLETVLTQAGFETVATGNGLDGVQAVRAYNPLVTTLDVSLPGIDGFEAAKRIRAFSNTYLIMLTARNDEIDTLEGLQAGADDYLTKPFRPRELRARIEAMQRRPRAMAGDEPAAARIATVPDATPQAPAAAPATAVAQVVAADASGSATTAALAADGSALPAPHDTYSAEDGWIEYNGLYVNSDMRLAEKDGAVIELTRSEFDLLNALMSSQRRVRSKADLALLLRGESYVTAHFVSESDKRAIEVHMANLRRKLGDSLTAPRWIETVRGIGYRLAAAESD